MHRKRQLRSRSRSRDHRRAEADRYRHRSRQRSRSRSRDHRSSQRFNGSDIRRRGRSRSPHGRTAPAACGSRRGQQHGSAHQHSSARWDVAPHNDGHSMGVGETVGRCICQVTSRTSGKRNLFEGTQIFSDCAAGKMLEHMRPQSSCTCRHRKTLCIRRLCVATGCGR